jgi:hypothetical protein
METFPMTITRKMTRPLVAALAVAAVAGPPAFAAGGPGAPGAAQWQRDHPQRADTGPVYWSYDYEAGDPQAAHEPKAALSLNTDDGNTPWTAIAAGIGGAGLLLGAGAAMAGRVRPRVST